MALPRIELRRHTRMLRAPSVIGRRIIATVLLGMSAASVNPTARLMASGETPDPEDSSQHASLKPASAATPDLPFIENDAQAEQELFLLANQARDQAGAPPLMLDAGLCKAARAHAQAMFEARELSHQFPGEPSLQQRLAAATQKQLDQAGENVALDSDAARAQEHLMLSPPHRANLLNSAYDIIGLGVVRSGDRLYVVQDFGHALPSYSSEEVKQRIAAAVAQSRRHVSQRDLLLRDLPIVDSAACSMAQADRLSTSPVQQLAQRYTVLTFTTLQPEALPENAKQALADRTLRAFSIGACYARTETYPTGVYWVVVALD
jgi:uncharacterized protein YkwD